MARFTTGQNVHRFLSVTRGENPVALALEQTCRTVPHRGVVFDHEHGFVSTRQLGRRQRGLRCGGEGLSRKFEDEGRPRAGRGLHGDDPFRLAHDALHGGQAQTGACARRLRAEKRLEDPGADVLGHAVPGIADGEPHR